ncbi:hypothetical protein FQA39_LY16872 [Lamprigera yunnana]|nr:hypothetical protein FQA39_LY16872 [Lamprigera yunnana]
MFVDPKLELQFNEVEKFYDDKDNTFGDSNFQSNTLDESLKTNEFKGYDILQKFFFLMIGGVAVFIVLTIIMKCCGTNSASIREGQRCGHRYCQQNNITACVFHVETPVRRRTSIDVPDVVINELEAVAEIEMLDVPPSYDVSTENSRHGSTNNLNNIDPPTYSEAIENT